MTHGFFNQDFTLQISLIVSQLKILADMIYRKVYFVNTTVLNQIKDYVAIILIISNLLCAVIDKIIQLNGKSVKVHVVAHCVGGLAMHIALLGGHISSSRIASLSCTNSSMFFKLTALASFKMLLPLLPVNLSLSLCPKARGIVKDVPYLLFNPF